jgi:hypothetical protein
MNPPQKNPRITASFPKLLPLHPGLSQPVTRCRIMAMDGLTSAIDSIMRASKGLNGIRYWQSWLGGF